VELGFAEASETVVLRVISQTERCFAVAPPVRALFPNASNSHHPALPAAPPAESSSSPRSGTAKSASGNDDGSTSSGSSGGLPEVLSYQSKALALFQKQDGADVCLFCMYVRCLTSNLTWCARARVCVFLSSFSSMSLIIRPFLVSNISIKYSAFVLLCVNTTTASSLLSSTCAREQVRSRIRRRRGHSFEQPRHRVHFVPRLRRVFPPSHRGFIGKYILQSI